MVQRMTTDWEKTEKLHEIDHIPKCKQRPRSSGGPKRRTDFSTFFCSSSSSSASTGDLGKGLFNKSSCTSNKLASGTIAGSEETRLKRKNVQVFPIVRCSSFQDKHQGLLTNIVDFPLVRVESFDQNSPSETLSARTVLEEESDIVRLEFTPTNSQVTEGSNLSMSPGSVVWAKKAQQLWWPAEALWEKECGSSEKQCTGSSDYPNYSNQQDQSPDKCNSSNSSRVESAYLVRRRGKRERKPSVRFDVSCPLTPVKKARRLRIMRLLGLAAPVGSPF